MERRFLTDSAIAARIDISNGRTRIFRNAAGPWSAAVRSSPEDLRQPPGMSRRRRDFHVLLNHDAVQDRFTNLALTSFFPGASKRGALKVTSRVCHSAWGLAGVDPGRVAFVEVVVPRKQFGPGIDPAAVGSRQLLRFRAVEDLNLVKPLEFHAGVRALRDQEFEVDSTSPNTSLLERLKVLPERAVDDDSGPVRRQAVSGCLGPLRAFPATYQVP